MALVIKNLPPNAGDVRHTGVGSLRQEGVDPWRRVWQPTPVFLPGMCYQCTTKLNQIPSLVQKRFWCLSSL